ncbi:MAG: hypothetical protein CUN56_15860, partial [Phototrophicales bacterium]
MVTLVWVFVAFFAFMGLQRGWTKEIISMSGIILGLFALHQFDTAIRTELLAAFTSAEKFYFQTALFLIIVFFAYQTRALVGSDARAAQGGDGRDALQSKVLGALVGGVNGYLISGSVWYFLHINRDANGVYPLDPYIVAPATGSLSAQNLGNLPLFVLAQGPGTT